MRRWKQGRCLALAATLVIAESGAAFADADEVSIGGTLTLGYAEVGDPVLRPLWPIPLAGLGARFTYAHLDWLAYEAGIEIEHTAIAMNFFHDREDPYPSVGRRLLWTRAEVGATFRLGVVYIPTLYLGLGAQGQMAQTIYETDAEGWSELVRERAFSWAPIGVVGAGFDYRLDINWIAGVSIRVRHAAPWDSDTYRSITALFHLSYYWYPGNIAMD